MTYFGSYGRYETFSIQFKCPNLDRDLYTLESAALGNRALVYPIGLISYDELAYAGMYKGNINKLTWVYSTNNYWTMSPSAYNHVNNNVYNIGLYNGYVNRWWGVAGSIGLRPVINLKSNVEISGGIGTVNDPYIVKTN